MTDVEDYPRMRGEEKLVTWSAGMLLGSPPRVRGRVRPRLLAVYDPGITPARAGKRALL